MWSIALSETGRSFGSLVWRRDFEPSGVSTVVYFASEDCAIEETKAKAAGGKVYRSKFGIGQYGHMALIQDTEGNLIGVHSRSALQSSVTDVSEIEAND